MSKKTRSGAKGGRKVGKRSRAKLASHSELGPSVPPSAASFVPKSELRAALRDALHFYDRMAGNIRTEYGWTAADVIRLEELRKLAKGKSKTPRPAR